MYTFISYQTADKRVAGDIKQSLEDVGVSSFLAHDDIEVSQEWAARIIEELARADVFVCLLSTNYCKSAWCIQESGIAAFRKGITVIPLKLDDANPPGFLSKFQATRINRKSVGIRDLLPGFFKHDVSKALDLVIEVIAGSGGYRMAEENFRFILPHVHKLSVSQGKKLLECVAENEQVYDAGQCALEYIPPLLKQFGRYLAPKTRKFLRKTCERYA